MTRSPHPGMDAPLLCELHAHSTWSDGALELEQVVDLYGRRGFDVLCITDHVVRGDDMLTAERHPAYLAAIRAEAERAAARYGMLVIPGLELTYDDPADSTRSAHAVAVGLERFVSLDGGIGAAMEEARAAGAALIAAHPHGAVPDTIPGRTTRRFWRDAELRSLVHRFELINRHRVFAWVAAAGLPAVANGDFHVPEHVDTWKTLLPCARTQEAVVGFLRSETPAALTRVEPEALPLRATA
jgi:predicted metal-dependent phosphoesterase TrpH